MSSKAMTAELKFIRKGPKQHRGRALTADGCPVLKRGRKKNVDLLTVDPATKKIRSPPEMQREAEQRCRIVAGHRLGT